MPNRSFADRVLVSPAGEAASPPGMLTYVPRGGVVRVRGAGKQRLYGLDAGGLRPIHEWVGGFERFWSESFDRLDTYVQSREQEAKKE